MLIWYTSLLSVGKKLQLMLNFRLSFSPMCSIVKKITPTIIKKDKLKSDGNSGNYLLISGTNDRISSFYYC